MANRARRARTLRILIVLGLQGGCLTSQGIGPNATRPLDVVPYVNLELFSGEWYVIESIGLDVEANAYDQEEIYSLRADGRIDVTATFYDGGFDGPHRILPQVGWVHDETTNAEWRIRPFWPLSLDYLIIDLDTDYAWSVVGHPSKRWVWIMSRDTVLDASILAGIRQRLGEQGYDVSRLRPIPQRPFNERPFVIGAEAD